MRLLARLLLLCLLARPPRTAAAMVGRPRSRSLLLLFAKLRLVPRSTETDGRTDEQARNRKFEKARSLLGKCAGVSTKKTKISSTAGGAASAHAAQPCGSSHHHQARAASQPAKQARRQEVLLARSEATSNKQSKPKRATRQGGTLPSSERGTLNRNY